MTKANLKGTNTGRGKATATTSTGASRIHRGGGVRHRIMAEPTTSSAAHFANDQELNGHCRPDPVATFIFLPVVVVAKRPFRN